MSVKLVETDRLPGIPVDRMKDGQIGVITLWEGHPDVLGRVVQRNGSNLISIGKSSGCGWANVLQAADNSGRRVRLLEPGERIEIVGNRNEG